MLAIPILQLFTISHKMPKITKGIFLRNETDQCPRIKISLERVRLFNEDGPNKRLQLWADRHLEESLFYARRYPMAISNVVLRSFFQVSKEF